MKYFTIEELTRTATGLKNVPNEKQEENLRALVEKVLDRVREKIKEPIIVTSGFRSVEVNKKVGGVRNSQHLLGCAADITLKDRNKNARLFQVIKDMCDNKEIVFDQLIWERGNKKYPLWVHVSYVENGKNRKQVIFLR